MANSQARLEASYLAFIEFMLLQKRRVAEIGGEHELTSMQAMTMILLNKPRSMHNFKIMFNCDASNITGIIDGLEHKDLVERYENRSDRRVKMIRLSVVGKRVRSALVRTMTSHPNPLTEILDDDQFETFVCLLEKINDYNAAELDKKPAANVANEDCLEAPATNR